MDSLSDIPIRTDDAVSRKSKKQQSSNIINITLQHDDKSRISKVSKALKTGRKAERSIFSPAGSVFDVGFLADVYQERPVGSPDVDKIVTRFPPEPNGYLHIGHSKAIMVNFGFAAHHGGECFLRFDDTNPKGERKEYFDSIEEMVRWLGFDPIRVTSSSDNFERLYLLAEELIRRDGAYVCHCKEAEIKDQRGGGENEGRPRYACPHRDRPIDESLREFRAMRDGHYSHSEAALRMKQDLNDPNPQMWDLFAYRILKPEESIHHRTGSDWKIYPTYDYTHCLCDSFEGITHSLCTTEFENSRQSYEWLCHKLDVYTPMQREYGRLNISGTVLSKRKIQDLVKGNYVRGWDDPRLYTLIALRRRGVPPGAIMAFVNEVGVSKADSSVDVRRFEQTLRKFLEFSVPRLMLIVDPLPVFIEGLPDDYLEMLEVPFSKDPSFGVHSVPFTNKVFIERSDFREEDSEDYFRLAPGKSVGLLKVPYLIKATSFEKDPDSGKILSVKAKYDVPEEGTKPKRPKTYIHWVADCPSKKSPVKAEVRIFRSLFKSANPVTNPAGFLADINPNSEEVFENSLIETGIDEIRAAAPWPKTKAEMAVEGGKVCNEAVRFQGMRVAYFTVDSDTTDDKLVLNQIVGLKEDAGKSS